MIVVVDDDELIRVFLEDVLAAQGHEVEAFADARVALARLDEVDPDLILSDIMMPNMDGLEFRRAYAADFPGRRTPFLFLTSLGGEDAQVRGLEAGADDYLVKPVSSALLLARVRACLRRAAPASPVASFQGELERCPFARLVEFCEAQGFTGVVEVASGDLAVAVPFRGGHLDASAPGQAAVLDRLFDLRSGHFLLRPRAPDFDALQEAPAVASAPRAAAPPPEQPVGRLSALPVGTRRLQLQTEFITAPEPALVSVAVLDGRTVHRRVSAARSPDRAGRQRQVDVQHAEVEAEIRERLASLVARRAEADPAEPTREERRDELIEQGLAAFLSGDHPAALVAWKAAAVLDPEHRTLQVNLGVVRRKLGQA